MTFETKDLVLALLGAANALCSWKLFAVLNRLDTSLAEMRGTLTGWNLDARVTELEKKSRNHGVSG